MSRIYYPQARAVVSVIPYDARGAERALNELITLEDLLPISLKYKSTDSKTADEFEVELPLRYFSQDPRLFRAVLVELHLGDTGGLDKPFQTSASTRLSLGHADEYDKSISASEATIKLKGRDYKAILLDEKWQGLSVAKGRALDVMIREVLDKIPAAAALKIRLDAPAPVVPAGKGKKRGLYRAAPDNSVFGALLELALGVGLMITIEADELVIRPPRSFSVNEDKAPLFVTAQNLTKLNIKRRYGVKDLPNVRVTALDRATMKAISGQYPSKPIPKSKISKAAGKVKKTSQTVIHTFQVDVDNPTQAKLEEIAQAIWLRYAQQQLSVSFETSDMSALVLDPKMTSQPSQETLDLTRLRNGHAVHVRIDPQSRTILESPISEDAKRRELQAQHYDAKVAEILARGWKILDTPLFVDTCTHSFDSKGYSLSADCSAFITVDITNA